MGAMSRSLKPILTGIWGLLLIPPIAAILEKRLEENLFSDPDAPATTVFSNLVVLGHQLWFHFVLVFFTGIVLGFSLDWLARKSDRNKDAELRSLGSKFRTLSDSIKMTESSEWSKNLSDLKPEIMSAFISAKKFGLWAPDERVYQFPDASFLCEYFKFVGKLLEDRHFDEAKREALAWKQFLDRGKLS
jgi:hypothetical protein